MQSRTVINKNKENTGPQMKYRKVQDSYKIQEFTGPLGSLQ